MEKHTHKSRHKNTHPIIVTDKNRADVRDQSSVPQSHMQHTNVTYNTQRECPDEKYNTLKLYA